MKGENDRSEGPGRSLERATSIVLKGQTDHFQMARELHFEGSDGFTLEDENDHLNGREQSFELVRTAILNGKNNYLEEPERSFGRARTFVLKCRADQLKGRHQSS